MLRKFLLPVLAVAVLAGCATDYSYRGGSGDYYYGRPQVEYRYLGPSGYYGGYYGYGAGPMYYYDRFGRLVYGYPYGYGAAYSASPYWYRQRPHRDRHDHHDDGDRDHHGDGDGDPAGQDQGRLPPWRNPGALTPGAGDTPARERPLLQRRISPMREPALPRATLPARPAMSAPSRRESGSRMGATIRAAKSRAAADDE